MEDETQCTTVIDGHVHGPKENHMTSSGLGAEVDLTGTMMASTIHLTMTCMMRQTNLARAAVTTYGFLLRILLHISIFIGQG